MVKFSVLKGLEIWCRLISRAWEIAGMRYEDPKLMKKKASSLLSGEAKETTLEYYYCRTSGGNALRFLLVTPTTVPLAL